MYIRYELYIDDEPQEIGFLQGISELDMDDETIAPYMSLFDHELIIPVHILEENRHTKSWFTEAGEQKFLADIKALCNLYESQGLFHVKRISSHEIENIIYADCFQVLQRCRRPNWRKEHGKM